nr:glycoprotein [Jingmen tick virus]UGM45885.1 glycoprotein [Jingmen tick virus]UGM45888.1 glycoprotein [Jingmen tick virus]UGM45892.1 glycoprotein [Jingmen tick virus]UGM45894.1 glycoprotein [Jingmen tick virus]
MTPLPQPSTMLQRRSRQWSRSFWVVHPLTLFICSCLLLPGFSQETSTSPSSAPSPLWDRLLGRTRRSSHSSPQSSFADKTAFFRAQLSHSRQLATSGSCRHWQLSSSVGSASEPGPLWDQVLEWRFWVVPEYGVPYGKVVTGIKDIGPWPDYSEPTGVRFCEDAKYALHMNTTFHCSDEKAYGWDCDEKTQVFLSTYEYSLNVDRSRAIWKYSIYTRPVGRQLGNCTVTDRVYVGTMWGSHKELYPLVEFDEDPLPDGSNRYSVRVLPNGRCQLLPNQHASLALRASEVQEPKVKYRAPFHVYDQLTPHGPSIGWFDQVWPDPYACIREGQCQSYPMSREPCNGENDVQIKQTLGVTRSGVKHRLTIRVTGRRGPCDPIITADSDYHEVTRHHEGNTLVVVCDLPLHQTVVTVRAGDTWKEHRIAKDVHQTIHEQEDDFGHIPPQWVAWLKNWFGGLTSGLARAFGLISRLVDLVVNNLPTVLVAVVLATPLGSALSPALRVFIIVLTYTVTRAKADGGTPNEDVLSVPLELFLHVAIAMFQGRDVANPVSLALTALSNLVPMPMPLVFFTLTHLLMINRDWTLALAGALAHRGGLPGVALYHMVNSGRLRRWGQDLAKKAEAEAVEQLPESHPWFDPPIRGLWQDLVGLQYHSQGYVASTLQAFLSASRAKREKKYRRVAFVRKGDIRSFKNFFLYPGEYHRLMPHLLAMSPSQRKVFRNNIPTILTRREGEYGPLLHGLKIAGYVGDLATAS